jgi:D-sedoheptulose 7-phosphate isomerase
MNSDIIKDKKYKLIKQRISDHLDVINLVYMNKNILEQLEDITQVIIKSFNSGGKLLICGNGGSAADAQHLAAELVGRFITERKALNAEALTVNNSVLTALANDYCFEKVFARQVEAKGNKGDVLLAITTSGNSKNVVEAIKAAKNVGMITVGLTGQDKESLIENNCDYCIHVPSSSTPRIQEAHILIIHIICEIIEKELFIRGG